MNGFKVFAVGAFLCCGPSFCHAQISFLNHQADPRSTLIKSGDDEVFQPATAAKLTRPLAPQAEVSSDFIDNPFAAANPSPSDILGDAQVETSPLKDPTSLPIGTKHRQNVIDEILRNGSIVETLDSAQVPVAWPMQQSYNPIARAMLYSYCTEGLWANYPAERAAECAHMREDLAGHQHHRNYCAACQPCRNAGCSHSSCATLPSHPINRYVSAGNHNVSIAPTSAPNPPLPAQQLGQQKATFLALPSPGLIEVPNPGLIDLPNPRLIEVAPLVFSSDTPNSSKNQDNLAQRPGLIR